ncbi:MAG: adenosylcobinamide-GDP ribazoletransferase [Agarilytica sp.]
MGKLNEYFQSFLSAVSLLTTLRIPHALFSEKPLPDTLNLSPVFYPVVGVVIGLVLWLVSFLLHPFFESNVVAACVLLTWVVVTGALHLDGLADCFDVMYAQHKGKTDLARVFKDPHVGVSGAVSLILCLLAKFVLLDTLLQNTGQVGFESLAVFCFVCGVSRLYIPVIMLTKAYVSSEGLASNIDVHKFRSVFIVGFIGFTVLSLLFLESSFVLGAFITIMVIYFWWTTKWHKLIGGYNGDCLGAFIEISETLCLFTFLIIAH